jgi:hypothetical protein
MCPLIDLLLIKMGKFIMSEFLMTSIILIIFIIDLIVPFGSSIAILYIVPLIISNTLSKNKIILSATASTILTITDLAIYYNSEMPYRIFTNRILSILAIWISCVIILRYKNLRTQKDLEKEKYLNSITEVLFKVSHQVRSPLCRMQGLTNHIDSQTITKEELESLSIYLKLDAFTRTLTNFLEKIRIENTNKTNSN